VNAAIFVFQKNPLPAHSTGREMMKVAPLPASL
jgi:hypothetical protein